jgi:hypothetical protein
VAGYARIRRLWCSVDHVGRYLMGILRCSQGVTSHRPLTKAIGPVHGVVGKALNPVWIAGDKVWITVDIGG